jgi:hypothetical protein
MLELEALCVDPGSPLWSSVQSSWLQIRRPGFDSQHYQKEKVVGLLRGPLSLVSTIKELFDRKVAAPVYKTENTAIGIRHADHVAPSILKKLAITSPTIGGRSVGIVRSRTQTIEFSFFSVLTPTIHAFLQPLYRVCADSQHIGIGSLILRLRLRRSRNLRTKSRR